jgi:hypothetical protein
MKEFQYQKTYEKNVPRHDRSTKMKEIPVHKNILGHYTEEKGVEKERKRNPVQKQKMYQGIVRIWSYNPTLVSSTQG